MAKYAAVVEVGGMIWTRMIQWRMFLLVQDREQDLLSHQDQHLEEEKKHGDNRKEDIRRHNKCIKDMGMGMDKA